jgi:uroporphyrinogen decarboxylase
MPIGAYVGLKISGGNVRDAVTDPDAQIAAARALHERFDTPVILTAMDLSVEAELFGCQIRMPADEVPTVIGRRATQLSEIDSLPAPAPDDGRTRLYLDVARRLVSMSDGTPVLGGMTGPFSLAGRIFGVSEALERTISEPATILALLEKVTRFLTEYALAFRAVGAAGVIIAEPAAGLLSPRSLARYSSDFIRRIVTAAQCENFAVILHNCGAQNVHLEKTLESGSEIYHFGALMNLPQALNRVGGKAILCGNLDPITVFHDGTPETVCRHVNRLIQQVNDAPTFVLSSGCDLTPQTPLENLESFYRAARGENPCLQPPISSLRERTL